VKYVLFYQSAPDFAQKAPAHFPAHQARWREFASAGTLLMVGPFSNPQEGAMAIFTTREAAESFAGEDPFVLNGVVSDWSVREWLEAIFSP
jgi:uncharacterized protein